jgi:hypothetical protein
MCGEESLVNRISRSERPASCMDSRDKASGESRWVFAKGRPGPRKLHSFGLARNIIDELSVPQQVIPLVRRHQCNTGQRKARVSPSEDRKSGFPVLRNRVRPSTGSQECCHQSGQNPVFRVMSGSRLSARLAHGLLPLGGTGKVEPLGQLRLDAIEIPFSRALSKPVLYTQRSYIPCVPFYPGQR